LASTSISGPRRRTPERWLLAMAAALAACAAALSIATVARANATLHPWTGIGLVGGALLAAGLMAWAALVLRHQRQQLRQMAQRVSSDLESGSWQDAVRSLRNDRLGAPSAFDTLATGFEEVLGESDRRWQTLADLAADWYWETDRQHRLAWVSGAGPLIASQGLRPSELIGRRHDQVDNFEAPNDGWAPFHALLDAGRPLRDLEFRVQPHGSDEARVWVAISGRPRRNAAGEVVGYEGVGRDISERKRAHERLRASEQRWSLMVGLATDYYWETDLAHRMLPLRPEVARRFGRLAEFGEGRTPWETYPGAMSTAAWDEHRADIAAHRPFQAVEMDIALDAQHRRTVAISGIPRFDGKGRFLGYHGIGRDITLWREAERLLLRHNEGLQRAVDERTQALERLNRDLDAFARQLAHELRTPIAQMHGLASLLDTRLRAQLAPEDRELIGLQIRAAQQMRDTVDALLQLARSSMQALPQETVDLSALARAVVAELPVLPRRAPVQWHLAAGVQVTGAPAALRIVLHNLLGNAAKFTRDTETPQVWLSARPGADGWLQLQLRDNGAGFDMARAETLFKPFVRLHRDERFAGTGIGLSIVQRIIERHGGSVTASGEVGQGACLDFTLRAAQDAVRT
jgi:PAS domain S-box-containing protein